MTILTLCLALSSFTATPAVAAPEARAPRPAAAIADDQNTPADSLYRAGQQALNRGEYQKAVDTYRTLRSRYPRSPRVGDALYWEAFGLYRLGGTTNLRVARERLKTQDAQYPNAGTRPDAGSLRVRVERDLSRLGDADARAWLDRQGSSAAVSADAAAPADAADGAAAAASAADAARDLARASRDLARNGDRRDDERSAPQGCDQAKFDDQMMAVQALMTMDRERAVPILKRVMARRDACSGPLRRQAIFILGQQAGGDSSITPLMLDVVKNDSDREVRKMALFALGQTRDPAAVPALAEVLRTSTDPEIQRQAVFALSQADDDRAGGILRDLITRPGTSDDVLRTAVMFLGQRRDGADAGFLRQVYPRIASQEAKKMVLMTLAQTGDPANARWLMDRVLDTTEVMELRRSALFFAGTQSRSVDVAQIAALYTPTLDREMRRQILFVLSQRREPAAVDKMLDIAKNDPDRDMRKQAVFWLGQSGDPRAAEFLEKMLDQ
ncbi:MAG TPA: HEAT repeat domain-containing protein [Gemmatimonadales bacterium]|nr:HEAT repeat domain-containing protein [Gemmatimonadales bacterium]